MYLDLLGKLPEPAEVDAYLADRNPDKYARLVARLLDRPEFIDYWAYQWGDLLRIESRRLGKEGAAAFHGWVREKVRDDPPLDGMVRELLLATGDSHRVGAANFSRVPADARAQAEYVSQVFLGIRLQCANCHNHPLDRWTQDDYHGLSAVFARLKRGQVVAVQERGEVIHPRTGKPAVPRIPGERFLTDAADPRDALADWLIARDNPYLARAAVNRIWAALMGRGLVEPIDDHRLTNPATHPELLDALAKDLFDNGYRLRHTIRTIVLSEAYRRSAGSLPGNRMDDRFHSKALIRPLPPVVLADAIAQATCVPEKLGDLPPGTTAISLGDSRVSSEPLDLLGRCSRDGECAVTPAKAGSLPLTLHAINGPWLNAKIGHPQGRLHKLLQGKAADAEIVKTLYHVALSRPPTAEETAYWEKRLASIDANDRTRRFEDFLWALLNAAEFGCNH